MESMTILKKSGPNIDPWGTLEVTLASSKAVPSRTTHCCRLKR